MFDTNYVENVPPEMFANHSWTIFPKNFREIQHTVDLYVFVVSMLANVTLIVLATTEKNQAIRAYSNVLLLNCIFDVLNTVCSFFFGLQQELSDGYYIMVANSIWKDIPIEYYYWFVAFYLSFVACAIHVIAVTFIFRYLLVCKHIVLSMGQLLKLIAGPVIYAFVECGSMAYSFYQVSSTPDREQICLSILDHPMWWEGTLDDHRPPAKCIFSRIENPFFIIFVVAATVIHSSVYIIMAKCAYDVLQELHKNKSNFSAKTRQLHRQMNYMLFSQMFAPILLAFTPVANMLVFPVFRLSLPGIGLLINILFASIPLMNPLIAIVFVGPFRRTLLRKIFRFVPFRVQCRVSSRRSPADANSSVVSRSDGQATMTNDIV